MGKPRCEQHDAFHVGEWRYCPWCGSALAPQRKPGTCARCGGSSVRPYARYCKSCFQRDAARDYIGGHTLEELAALYAEGLSLHQIAARLMVPGPRKGPQRVEYAIELFWTADGSPGEPAEPQPDPFAGPEYWNTPAWDRWRATRKDAIRDWLLGVARRSEASA